MGLEIWDLGNRNLGTPQNFGFILFYLEMGAPFPTPPQNFGFILFYLEMTP